MYKPAAINPRMWSDSAEFLNQQAECGCCDQDGKVDEGYLMWTIAADDCEKVPRPFWFCSLRCLTLSVCHGNA